jgi:hypothetical protein
MFAETLPSNDKDGLHIQTEGRGFMKHAVEMGSDATIFIPSFIKIGSCIQKADEGGIHRPSAKWCREPVFKIMKVG